MTVNPVIAPLRTPEEVADLLVHISPFTIRRMVQKREIAYTPGARGKVLFSEAQVQGIIDHLTIPAAPAPEPEDDDAVFGTTSRSNARNRRAS